MSSRPPLLAGIDLGTTHIKALISDGAGTVLARSVRRTPVGPDHRHPADDLLAAALDALTECATATGRAPDAIGVTGMAEAGVPLDRDGRPLGDLRAWSDPAPASHAQSLGERLGATALHRATGILPSPKVPLAKWCALADREPGTAARMHAWAGAADLLAHALTGRLGTDGTFAQRTMAWDPHRKRWIEELLTEAHLEPRHMPPVHAPGEPVGTVTPAVAARHALGAGAPVVVAGHDHLVGAWAAAVRTAGQVADSMGTAEAVLTVSATPPDPSAAAAEGMSWGRHADGEHFIVLAGMRSSGALVEWFCDQFMTERQGSARYAEFERLAQSLPVTPTGLVVAPYPGGRSAPRPDPHATLDVTGLGLGHGPADLARAVLEGAAHHARWMTDTQAVVCGAAADSVTLLGGSTRLSTWTALKAAVCPWPTRVCAEPEAPALGAAGWAGAALGLDPAATTAPAERVVPDQAAARAHRAFHHERFLAAVAPTPPH
ncbi:L-fuculokinase [Streptomyces sp. NPDC102467]|uniref:FGGY-family carbohydrate kinase n=1 Tax=Streptomyces sp. NPDC102467 TaxID=3366179 RepID=UPI003830D5D0